MGALENKVGELTTNKQPLFLFLEVSKLLKRSEFSVSGFKKHKRGQGKAGESGRGDVFCLGNKYSQQKKSDLYDVQKNLIDLILQGKKTILPETNSQRSR